ncbi:MAG TPA: hypothetical protein VFU08_00865 [Candidatus Udaeobacter sp.]|nr:hypothetical protein [Candidatus Udaeobacter sp.]
MTVELGVRRLMLKACSRVLWHSAYLLLDFHAGVFGHRPSFLCALGDLHWTVTLEPGEHVPVMIVPEVRWITQ